MRFAKLHGCANDFIVTHELREEQMPGIIEKTPHLCDRRRGVGGDGLIAVLPSSTADFKMRIINADGSEPEMCGNGIRCCAVYLRRMNLTHSTELAIETLAGIIRPAFIGNDMVRVNMGAPILDGKKIPTISSAAPVLNEKIKAGERTFCITAVSMGNPHAVIYAGELTDELVLHYGKILEAHPFFPRKTNVEFVKVLSDSELQMRVYERGCGETMACGTGACASMVAGVLNKKNGNDVTIHLLGGDLRIEWDGNWDHPVFMTGPAQWAFEGTVDVDI